MSNNTVKNKNYGPFQVSIYSRTFNEDYHWRTENNFEELYKLLNSEKSVINYFIKEAYDDEISKVPKCVLKIAEEGNIFIYMQSLDSGRKDYVGRKIKMNALFHYNKFSNQALSLFKAAIGNRLGESHFKPLIDWMNAFFISKKEKADMASFPGSIFENSTNSKKLHINQELVKLYKWDRERAEDYFEEYASSSDIVKFVDFTFACGGSVNELKIESFKPIICLYSNLYSGPLEEIKSKKPILDKILDLKNSKNTGEFLDNSKEILIEIKDEIINKFKDNNDESEKDKF